MVWSPTGDPAAAVLRVPRSAAGTSMHRCCRAGAARRDTPARRSSRATRPRASPSCQMEAGLDLDHAAGCARHRSGRASMAARCTTACRCSAPRRSSPRSVHGRRETWRPAATGAGGRDLRREIRKKRRASTGRSLRSRSTPRCVRSIPGRVRRPLGTASNCASGSPEPEPAAAQTGAAPRYRARIGRWAHRRRDGQWRTAPAASAGAGRRAMSAAEFLNANTLAGTTRVSARVRHRRRSGPRPRVSSPGR